MASDTIFDQAWQADLDSVAAIMEEEVKLGSILIPGTVDVLDQTNELVVGGKSELVTFDIYLSPQNYAIAQPAKGTIVEWNGMTGRVNTLTHMGGGGVKIVVTAENPRTERLF